MMRETGERLRQVVDAASPRLTQIDDSESARQPSAEKWSRKQVLGHLIDSASNNHQRFIRAQLSEELAFPGYDQEGWVQAQRYDGESWADMVAAWSSFNRHLAHVISSIPEEAAGRRCAIGDNPSVTLAFLASDYVDHLEHHLGQILS